MIQQLLKTPAHHVVSRKLYLHLQYSMLVTSFNLKSFTNKYSLCSAFIFSPREQTPSNFLTVAKFQILQIRNNTPKYFNINVLPGLQSSFQYWMFRPLWTGHNFSDYKNISCKLGAFLLNKAYAIHHFIVISLNNVFHHSLTPFFLFLLRKNLGTFSHMQLLIFQSTIFQYFMRNIFRHFNEKMIYILP